MMQTHTGKASEQGLTARKADVVPRAMLLELVDGLSLGKKLSFLRNLVLNGVLKPLFLRDASTNIFD